MHYLERARTHGLKLRLRLDATLALSPTELFDALADHLWENHKTEVTGVSSIKLGGGNAEIKPGYILYNRELDREPTKRLKVLAHEAGHLTMHIRLHRHTRITDPVSVGTYVAADKNIATARYDKRSQEEAEAEAFGVEFVCPSTHIFRWWKQHPERTSRSAAKQFYVREDLARAQLTEGFYRQVFGDKPHLQPSPAKVNRTVRDPSQEQAICHTGSPVLVEAGPGCGKTSTLVRRVRWLIEQGISSGTSREEIASQVLILTFSNEAVLELHLRLHAVLGDEIANHVDVMTFHGFGRQVLRAYGDHVGVPSNVRIIDELQQKNILLQALGTVNCDGIFTPTNPDQFVHTAWLHIQYIKRKKSLVDTNNWTPEKLKKFWSHEYTDIKTMEIFCKIYEEYERIKSDCGMVDFADLISKCNALFQHPEAGIDVTAQYQNRYPHILVDEFQDVSRNVNTFLALLCGDGVHPWVVGDSNQAIYRFINAAPENITLFKETFKNTEVFRLGFNYRSSDTVVHTANQLATLLDNPKESRPLLQEYFDPKAAEGLGTGCVRVVRATTVEAEYHGVIAQVKGWLEQGVRPHEIAVLARTNNHVRQIVKRLSAEDIQTSSRGLLTPEGPAGDLAAIVTCLQRPRASLPRVVTALARRRFSTNEVNETTRALIEHLRAGRLTEIRSEDAACEHELFNEAIRVYETLSKESYVADAFTLLTAFLFDSSDYLRHLLKANRNGQVDAHLDLLEVITVLSQAAAFRCSYPPSSRPQHPKVVFGNLIRQKLTKAIPSAIVPGRTEAGVQVMTCHASKGLEFGYVCLTGQRFNRKSNHYEWLPDALQPDHHQDVEQANALLFVGVTRAKNSVTISYPGYKRNAVPLLRRLITYARLEEEQWTFQPSSKEITSFVRPVWGNEKDTISARHINPESCPVKIYLEQRLGLRFPDILIPAYPLFYEVVMSALKSVFIEIHSDGAPLSPEAAHMFLDWTKFDGMDDPHPYLSAYKRIANRIVESFISNSMKKSILFKDVCTEPFDFEQDGVSFRVRSIARFEHKKITNFLLFSMSSLQKPKGERGLRIPLGRLSGAEPARALALTLFDEYPESNIYIFSGLDGKTYLLETDKTQRQAALTERQKLVLMIKDQKYQPKIDAWKCDSCESRIICPAYLKDITN